MDYQKKVMYTCSFSGMRVRDARIVDNGEERRRPSLLLLALRCALQQATEGGGGVIHGCFLLLLKRSSAAVLLLLRGTGAAKIGGSPFFAAQEPHFGPKDSNLLGTLLGLRIAHLDRTSDLLWMMGEFGWT